MKRLLYITSQFKKAESYVNSAENNSAQLNIDVAWTLVNPLTVGKRKRELISRLNALVISQPDTTAPIITLTGGNITIDEGIPYSEPGFSASDDVDGDITANVVVNYGGMDINDPAPGQYTVTYNVSDAAQNPAEEKSRTVTVEAVYSDSYLMGAYIDPEFTNRMRLQFNDDAYGTEADFIAGFSVNASPAVDVVGASSMNTDEVWLDLSRAVVFGESLTLDYDAQSGGITDWPGDKYASFSGFNVVNNVVQPDNPPSTPDNIVISSIQETSAALDWSDATDDNGVSGYNVFLNGVKKNTSLIAVSNYSLTGLTAGTTYDVTVESVDTIGQTAVSAVTQFTTTGTAPTLARLTYIDFEPTAGVQSGKRTGAEIYLAPATRAGDTSVPTFFYAHGANEYCRVADTQPINYLAIQEGPGFSKFINEGGELPFNLVSPQLSRWEQQWDYIVVEQTLDQVTAIFPFITKQNISVGGYSQGSGGFLFAQQHPTWVKVLASFACVNGVPNTQSAMNAMLDAGVAIWNFHAQNDGTITYNANPMTYMLAYSGFNADKHRMTSYTNQGHGIMPNTVNGIGYASSSSNGFTPYPNTGGNYPTLSDFIMQWG